MSVRVTIAAPQHLEDIVKLLRANTEIFGFSPRGAVANKIKKQTMLCAFDGDTLVGMLNFHIRRDAIITIYHFAVNESLRGSGIGTSLLATLVDIGFRQKCRFIQLKVIEDTPAVGFYTAKGFRQVGKEPRKAKHLLIMRKPLCYPV